MQDHQVEVVPGPHAAARVAGAVVLVAHRGPGRPTEDSPAVRALVALVALVYEAANRQPQRPGPLIAREATRWLTARTGALDAPDFAIVSAAGPDRVAIFLHGAVTAVLDGTATEYLHGRDAVFTVDRVAAVPSRAVAVFVDELGDETADHESQPVLPAARGIGRLVEGIAEASGVISWSPGASRPGGGRRPGPARGVVLGKGAAEPEQTARSRAERGGASDDAPPPEHAEPVFATEQESTVSSGPRATDIAAEAGRADAAAPAPEPVEAVDPHRAETEISGRQEPGAIPDPSADETQDSRPRHHESPPSAGPAHPTPHRDQPVNEMPLYGPPERHAPPDAELRRRTEATAKGAAMTVKVRGFKCARAHPTDPRAAFCSVCGMPVDQTQPLIDVVRPPLGMLLLDDGATHVLETDSVIGRDPEQSEPARRGLTPLKLVDNSGGMSRAHAELLLREWNVMLVDRGSTNGTRTRLAGQPEWVRVPPSQPVVLVPRTEILIGNRVLRFESAAPPPFGS